MATTREIMNGLKNSYFVRYMQSDPASSIERCKHMNNLCAKLDFSFIQDVLVEFLAHCETNYQTILIDCTIMAVLNFLVVEARSKDYSTEEEKAVVVDFINFVAYTCGVDYALYTKDI